MSIPDTAVAEIECPINPLGNEVFAGEIKFACVFQCQTWKMAECAMGESIVSGVKEMTVQHKKYSPKTVQPSACCRL